MDYFSSSPETVFEKGVTLPDPGGRDYRFDFVFQLGAQKIALELKHLTEEMGCLDQMLDSAQNQAVSSIKRFGFDGAVVILLLQGKVPAKYLHIEKRFKGKVTVVPVSFRL